MKIVFISENTPTPFNLNGPSALPFYLLKSILKDKDVKCRIYTLNSNGANEELLNKSRIVLTDDFHLTNYHINKVKLYYSKIVGRLSRKSPVLDFYKKLPVKVVNSIKGFCPDVIWIYPHHLLGVAKQVSKYCDKLVVLGPDCASLHFCRSIQDSYIYRDSTCNSFAISLQERINLERGWKLFPNSQMILVGHADQMMYNTIVGGDYSKFFPHPHYEKREKIINLDKEKLKILISGKPDIYTYTDINIMLDALITMCDPEVKNRFEFIFHGKDWSEYANKLCEVGFVVNMASWVDDYTEFVIQHDIQLFPISVGTGTKGKVLDALANGILCIGSKYSFENIAISDRKSAIIYESATELPSILKWVHEHRNICTEIAVTGRERIRKYHNPDFTSGLVMDWIKNNDYKVPTKEYFTLSFK